MSKSLLVYYAASGIILAVILGSAVFLNVGYYENTDLFGPLAKFPTLLLAIVLGVALAMTHAFGEKRKESNWRYGPSFYALPIVLLAAFMMILPDAIEKYYVTNHYDVLAHIARASYVTEKGNTNIRADSYFDLQPGVFYSTAFYFIVSGIEPSLIAKWFPFFFVVMLYVPALLYLGKPFFKEPHELTLFVFLGLVINWTNRYHYSAQVYLLPVFAVMLGLIIRGALDRTRLIAVLILYAGITVTHQGIAIFSIAMLASVLVFQGFQKLILKRVEKPLASHTLFITLLMVWLIYLGWLTVYAFRDLLVTLNTIIVVLLTEPLANLLARAVARPNEAFQNIVYMKIIFTLGIYLVGLIILAYYWLVKRITRLGTLFAVIFGVSSVIFILGSGLGGTSYVERAMLVAAPLLAVPITILMSRIREVKPVLLVALITLTLMGTFLFNTNRNFESRLMSEDACSNFLTIGDPIKLPPPYAPIEISRYSYADVQKAGTIPNGDFLVMRSFMMESSYWVHRNVLSNLTNVLDHRPGINKYYSNSVCSIYYVPP